MSTGYFDICKDKKKPKAPWNRMIMKDLHARPKSDTGNSLSKRFDHHSKEFGILFQLGPLFSGNEFLEIFFDEWQARFDQFRAIVSVSQSQGFDGVGNGERADDGGLAHVLQGQRSETIRQRQQVPRKVEQRVRRSSRVEKFQEMLEKRRVRIVDRNLR